MMHHCLPSHPLDAPHASHSHLQNKQKKTPHFLCLHAHICLPLPCPFRHFPSTFLASLLASHYPFFFPLPHSLPSHTSCTMPLQHFHSSFRSLQFDHLLCPPSFFPGLSCPCIHLRTPHGSLVAPFHPFLPGSLPGFMLSLFGAFFWLLPRPEGNLLGAP